MPLKIEQNKRIETLAWKGGELYGKS